MNTVFILLMGMVSGSLIYIKYGLSLAFASFLVMSLILATASVEDLKSKTIPNQLVLLGIISGFILSGLHLDLSHSISAVLGMGIAGGSLFVLSVLSKGGIGMGDVKLFACVGIFLGIEQILSAMVLSVMASGLVGVILLLLRVSKMKSTLPFAPFIFVGALGAVLL